jgi:hypothetical protein
MWQLIICSLNDTWQHLGYKTFFPPPSTTYHQFIIATHGGFFNSSSINSLKRWINKLNLSIICFPFERKEGKYYLNPI